jgi:Protein SOSEKI 2, plant
MVTTTMGRGEATMMVTTTMGRGEATREWKEKELCTERAKAWSESMPKSSEKKVAVVYYLSRNGHFEHPHFMKVALSSSDGLYLKGSLSTTNLSRIFLAQ